MYIIHYIICHPLSVYVPVMYMYTHMSLLKHICSGLHVEHGGQRLCILSGGRESRRVCIYVCNVKPRSGNHPAHLEDVTLTFDLWPWPFAWTSLLTMVITPENFMMIRWWEHGEKGVTDGRTDRRTDWTSHIAAWSQLKTSPRMCPNRHSPDYPIEDSVNRHSIPHRHTVTVTKVSSRLTDKDSQPPVYQVGLGQRMYILPGDLWAMLCTCHPYLNIPSHQATRPSGRSSRQTSWVG